MATMYFPSTYEDLKDSRRVVFKALRKSSNQVIAMEDYFAADQRPVENCRTEMEKADLYVGIFAFALDHLPPPDGENPNG